MLLWRGMTEPDAAFLNRLKTLEANADTVVLDSNQDRDTLSRHLRELSGDIESGKFDAIYSFGTTATRVTTNFVKDRIPVVFNVVFDPVEAQLVQAMDRPGANVTGVTNGVPIADQFNAFQRLLPLKSMIVLFNPKEPNSNMIAEQVAQWGLAHGVQVIPRRVGPASPALDETLEEIKAGSLRAEALYAGADSYLSTKADAIKAAVGDRIPLLGGTQSYTANGWLAAYAPTLADMGAAAADVADRILKGADARTLPVVLPQPKMVVSKAAAAIHRITVPADALLEN
ncbi:ABC transporter substrate-binding protein [Azospirillum canadense]|uniref:ABC transporter substrate-binding protein n=1 Tax=Azospirillum canadense TaxID=403962 RepID=UPI00222738E1|nr:ABC transporter substrate-binding protein [Azospirillum canadense]MCW2242638.1 putative ABC transport system substrate-binding protein [Azospirillum canadense]